MKSFLLFYAGLMTGFFAARIVTRNQIRDTAEQLTRERIAELNIQRWISSEKKQ